MVTTTEMKIGMAFPEQVAVLDTESTGVDPQEARIVTCFIGIMDTATGQVVERWSWLVDPGVEIPKGASDVHGITTERARAEGMDPKEAIFQIVQRIDIIHKRSLALVIMNASYDMTLIDREVDRHWPGMRPPVEGHWEYALEAHEWKPIAEPDDRLKGDFRWVSDSSPVIFDPMVFDRAVDKYRKGTRKLVDLCRVYGVPVEENAHDAEADCRMAGRVAIKLLGHSRLQPLSLSEVHDKLVPTKRNQNADLLRFWREVKLPKITAPEERKQLLESIESAKKTGHYWPLIPRGIS